jgi:colanic acid/amylovoran biosynthesis glycosyltransferase
MRVGFVVSQFPRLSETFVASQVTALAQRGFEVSVVCDRIGSDSLAAAETEPMKTVLANTHRWWPDIPGLRGAVRRLPWSLRDKVSTAADLLNMRELNRCDVVIAHFGGNGMRLARAKKRNRLRPPFFTIFHGSDVGVPAHKGTLGQYAPLFRFGERQLTVNEVFRKALIGAGAPEAQVLVHRMGIDCRDMPFRNQDLGGDTLRLISVCRLVEKKGIRYALHALAALKAERPRLDWRYSVVGDGPLRAELLQLARELGIGERVTFHGALPHREVKTLLSRAHVFLLPSVTAEDGDVEGVPVALMEAMASGLVAVSTFHSGIPELIEHQRTGFLASEKDVGGIAAHLISIAERPEALPAMTAAARRHIESEFNNEILNDRLAAMVTSRLAERRAA